MEQMNTLKKITKIILIILLLLSTTFLTQYISVFLQNYKSEYSGVPDLVNSFSTNSDYTLTVIANSDTIENKEDFACQIITMCRENSFKTLRFSTDLGGYPTSLDISVYLHQKDIRTSEPICKIRYIPNTNTKEYDIKNHPEEFQLYLDGKEIKYY